MPPNPGSGPGKRRRASRIGIQSAWPWLSEAARVRRGPVGGAEAVAAQGADAGGDGEEAERAGVGDRGVEGAGEVEPEARPR